VLARVASCKEGERRGEKGERETRRDSSICSQRAGANYYCRRARNLILIFIVFIFVFSSLHILGGEPEQDPTVSTQAGSKPGGWRDWKWPGYGEKDKDGGRWSDGKPEGPEKPAQGAEKISEPARAPEPPSAGPAPSEAAPPPPPSPAPVAGAPKGEDAPKGDASKPKPSQSPASNGTIPAPAPPPPAPTCRSDLARHARQLSALNTTFEVADDIFYDPAGPRPEQIVILTATDGGGHNGGIDNIVERAAANRKAYCEFQGYTYHFVNISKFDLDGAHPVWKKLPAIVETFNTYPDAQWVWMLDLDAIIMTPTADLREILLSKKGMERALDRNAPLHQANWKSLGLWTPDTVDFQNTDFLIAQDHNGVNAGSFFVRRSKFTQLFIDMWADPFFRKMNWPGQEQEAIVRTTNQPTDIPPLLPNP